LILESTFADLRSFAPKFLIPSFLIKTDYNNLERIKNIYIPILIFHSRNDQTVPYENAIILDKQAMNSKLITYTNKHYEPPEDIDKHYDIIYSFIDKIIEKDE
jgi:fermentation-respiration switch protein FrsA (DUF1100 family)